MPRPYGIGDLAALGFGQIGPLLDTMEMMSKTWSAMALPSALTPTMSLEELDKRIGELRSIEQWLTINQNMLRTTIQGLEVQRGTIAALRSFSDAVSSRTSPPRSAGELAQMFAAAQKSGASTPAKSARAADTGARSAGTPARPADTRHHEPAHEEPAAPDEAAHDPDPTQARPQAASSEMPREMAQLAQAWWNMLGDQFQQVAGAALEHMGRPAAKTDKPAPAADKPAKATTPARAARSTKAGAKAASPASASPARKRSPRTE